MAAAAAGIFNHAMTAGQALTGKSATATTNAAPATGGTSNSSDTGTATVSANDFLTLLVTEMQNQDPTANTDPNEYINQLVQVNSLEQLIDINQTLSGDAAGAAGSSSAQAASSSPASAATAQSTKAPAAGAIHAAQSGTAMAHATPAGSVFGNLSVPAANPSATRVGQSLGGRTHARHISGTTAAR